MPFACGYYDGKDYIYFWDNDFRTLIEQVVLFIREKKVIIYAHNGGKFDWHYFFDYFNIDTEQGNKQFKIINGRIAKAFIGKAELRDSYMIMPAPLKTHNKDEIRYSIMEPEVRDQPRNKEKILAYLKTDCISLHIWITKFVDRFGLKFTVAGAAFDQIKKSGYNTDIKTDGEYDSQFRQYYFGGRTQAFKTGAYYGHYIYVDINSAYPYAMKRLHPYGDNYTRLIKPGKLPKKGLYPMYFATIKAISKGCLPHKDKKINKIEYYNDNEVRTYYATSWEIEAGLETGTLEVIEVDELLLHLEHNDFGEFIEKFYNEKKESKKQKNDAKKKGDKEGEQAANDSYTFTKFILNSGYGKFGQNPNLFKKYELVKIGEIPIDAYPVHSDYGWSIESEYPTGMQLWSRPDPGDSFFNVAVAASITGFVRAYLWRNICRSTGVLYCDTDSIICKTFDGKISAELGEWEKEGETNDAVYIGGRKLYTFPITEGESVNGYHCYKKIKKAHKGARLTHTEIMDIVKDGIVFSWKNIVPTYSIKKRLTGDKAEFITRRIKVTI